MAMSSLVGARVLLAGASGLIGTHVLRHLVGEAAVVAVSRFAREDEDGVRWVQRDLAEPGAMTATVDAERPDVVIHLAGAVRGERTLDAVGPTLRANLLSTVELLEALPVSAAAGSC